MTESTESLMLGKRRMSPFSVIRWLEAKNIDLAPEFIDKEGALRRREVQ